MTVSTTEAPNLSLYDGGNLDPRLPAGRWWKEILATGDASGGQLQNHLEFFPASSPPSTFCFSLDGISAGGVSAQVIFRLAGWSLNPRGEEMTDRAWEFVMLNNKLTGSESTFLPMLLGYRVDGQQAKIEFTFPTNTNSSAYNVSAWGEFWLESAKEYIGAQQPAGSAAFEASRPAESQGSYIDIRAGRPPPQVPQYTTMETATPFPLEPPPVLMPVPVLAAPTKPVTSRPSPAAAQDPHAKFRADLVRSLAAQGIKVATIPGNDTGEIASNYDSIRSSRSQARAISTPAPRAAAPRSSRTRSTTTNTVPTGRQTPKPVAAPTFSQTQFEVRRLNIAATNARAAGKITRPRSTNPTGGNSISGSSRRRDIFENEG